MKGGLAVGLVLLTVSAWPLFLMGRELAARRAVQDRYQFEGISGVSDRIGTTEVRLKDNVPGSDSGRLKVKGPIKIEIGGKDFSVSSPIGIRPHYSDIDRYQGFAHLVRARDTSEGASYLVVMQNLGTGGKVPFFPNVRWRALWVNESGSVREDVFGYQDRCSPPVRSWLANWVSPTLMGCHSDLMQGTPNLLYPLLYPWVSGAVGLLLVLIFGTTVALRALR